jgi:hypothetical protein
MFAGSTILYKMLVCLSESRGGLHMENLFLATVDNAIQNHPYGYFFAPRTRYDCFPKFVGQSKSFHFDSDPRPIAKIYGGN